MSRSGSGRPEGVGRLSALSGVAMVAATVGRLSGVGEAARGVGSLCAVGLEKIRAVGSQGPESVQALRWSRQWSGGRGSQGPESVR